MSVLLIRMESDAGPQNGGAQIVSAHVVTASSVERVKRTEAGSRNRTLIGDLLGILLYLPSHESSMRNPEEAQPETASASAVQEDSYQNWFSLSRKETCPK